MKTATFPVLVAFLISPSLAQKPAEQPSSKASRNQQSTMTCNDLHKAAEANDVTTLQRVLATGVSADCRNEKKQTALLIATIAGSTDVARLLIDAGSNVNAQADNLDSPLLYAGAAGRLEILKLCLAANPDFTVTNRYGGTALIPACERGHVEVVKELLKTKIPVNHVNRLGWTALLEAVILSDGGPKHQEIVKLLLTHGADRTIADKDGVTALQHAKQRGYKELAALLEKSP